MGFFDMFEPQSIELAARMQMSNAEKAWKGLGNSTMIMSDQYGRGIRHVWGEDALARLKNVPIDEGGTELVRYSELEGPDAHKPKLGIQPVLEPNIQNHVPRRFTCPVYGCPHPAGHYGHPFD